MLTIQVRTEAGSTLNFFWKYLAQLNIAYHDKSEKYIHKFIFLPEFQSHNTLHLLLLHVYKEKVITFTDFWIEIWSITSTHDYDVCIPERYWPTLDCEPKPTLI